MYARLEPLSPSILFLEVGDTMLDWSTCAAATRDAQKVSGIWVFQGSRVPVRALFENLEDGATVDEFLEWFPGVTKTQVQVEQTGLTET